MRISSRFSSPLLRLDPRGTANDVGWRIYLIGLVLLSVWAYAFITPAVTLAASSTYVDQLVLANFDNPVQSGISEHAETWQRYPRVSGNAVHFALNSTERQGNTGHSLHLDYSFASKQSAEIGLRLNFPELDASRFDHLAFWVKGDENTNYADTIKVAFKSPDPKLVGFEEQGSRIVNGITDSWQRVLVPLNLMSGLQDWTHLSAFVIAFHARRVPAPQGAYYIDDVRLVKTGEPGPSILDPVPTPRKQAWEQAVGGRQASQPHLKARLVGWPERVLVDQATLPKDDDEFLRRLARDTWRGLEALTDQAHGLPLDTVRFDAASTDPSRARIGDYTNVTNIGLYLIAVVAAHDLGFIDSAQALQKIRSTLGTLESLETYKGFFFNYYDTTTLERTSNFISFVDSSWLTTGLLIVRMAFPELHARATRLIEQGDYGFFYDPIEQQMSHGYYVNLPAPAEYNYGILVSEARLGSLIAIGKGDVPEEHWFRMARIFPPEYTWQSLIPRDYRVETVRGFPLHTGIYRWGDFTYVPSWGGSMFEVLMPTLVLDETRFAPANLGKNAQTHIAVQRHFALNELGYPVWGLSPSSTPEGDDYSEYGVKVLGARGYKAGAVTPHASALALTVTPELAIENLRKLAEQYRLYGEYGLYDAVNPRTGQVAYKYLALDQAMLFISLANYLDERRIQRRFAADPLLSKALPLLSDEQFFE